MTKFMQTVDQEIFKKLAEIAKERGITVQELVRAVIIPEWLKATHKPSKPLKPKFKPVSSPMEDDLNPRVQGMLDSIDHQTKKSKQNEMKE